MLKFTGFNGKEIFIVREKIVGMQEADQLNYTKIFVSCETGSEEWIVQDSLSEVFNKYTGDMSNFDKT